MREIHLGVRPPDVVLGVEIQESSQQRQHLCLLEQHLHTFLYDTAVLAGADDEVEDIATPRHSVQIAGVLVWLTENAA